MTRRTYDKLIGRLRAVFDEIAAAGDRASDLDKTAASLAALAAETLKRASRERAKQ